MKTVEVQANFPEVVVDGYAVDIKEEATASTFKAATSKALGLILKNPTLKRKRFTIVTLSVAAK